MKKTHIWRGCCAWALCGALLSTAVPQAGWTAEDEPMDESGAIQYESWDDLNHVWKNEVLGPDAYEFVQPGDTDWNDDNGGWYVVQATDTIIKTYDRIKIDGDVHLILMNGSSFECQNGIQVSEGSSLSIYGQEANSDAVPGTLNVKIITENAEYAGIGGSKNAPDAGTINIHGGIIDVQGNRNSAGIGGSSEGTTGEINLYGGEINATGGRNGAGIGGGDGISKVDSIIINERANVTATGGIGGGAGIGGGRSGNCDSVQIDGGVVKADGKDGGAGIGSGSGNRNKGTILISGGTVIANGGDGTDNGGAGIGGSGGSNSGYAGGSIIIDGGYVIATGGIGSKNCGDGIGNGGGFKSTSSDPSTFSTGDQGNGIIFAYAGGENASAIYDISGRQVLADLLWKGIIFENGDGKVYGDVTLSQSFEIPKDTTLTIDADDTLRVPDGIILTNKGSIVGNGTLIGAVAEKQPADTIDRGRVTINAASSEGGTVSGAGEYTKGEDVTLTATVDPHYRFSGWFEGENNVSADASYTFKAASDRTLTAKFEKTAHAFGQWQGDGNGHHIRTCTISGCTEQEQDACSGGTATCSDRAVCSICKAQYGSLDPDNHTEGTAWTTTATTHTSVYPCCGAAAGPEAAHSWQDGACAVCGYHCLHALHFVERVDATTSQTGVEAHYACDHCGLLFRDAAGAEPVTAEELIIPVQDTPSAAPDKPGVKLEASENGSVDVSTNAPAYQQTVTITPVPDAGYHVAGVSVTDRRGQAVAVTAQDDGSYTYIQPWGTVTINVTFARDVAASVTEIFTDIQPGAWYEDAVQFAYDKGWLTGTSATTFAPDAAATRGMIVSILHRLAGAPAAETDVPFEDVASGAWYADAVRWGVAEGLISGYDDATFGPDDAVTREQLAAMLQRYDQWRGESDGTRSDLSGYEDASAISGWAIDAVAWAHAQGLLTGTSETTLDPQGPAVRAQVAAMLQRFPGE